MTSPTGLLDDEPDTRKPVATRSRWAERAPDLIGLAVVCAVILLGYFEVPFAGKTFSTASTVPGVHGCRHPDLCLSQNPRDPRVDPGASATQMEPWGYVVSQAVADGEVPLWNPYQGIGAPLAADMPTGAFDPLLVGLHLHPTPLVQDMTFLAALLLIGMGAYWAARMLGLGPVAATLTGCVYGLSGWFFEYGNNEWFWTLLYLPVILALCEWCLRTNRRLPVVLLGGACASMIFAGMPEIFFIAFVAIGVYAVTRLFIGPRVQGRWIAALRLLVGGVLGLAIAAPIVLLFAEYLPLSYNQHSGLAGTPPPTDPVDLVINWMVPKISPIAAGDYASTRNWVGAAAVVLVCVAFASPRAMRRYTAWPIVAMGGALAIQIYGGSLVGWTRVLPFWSATNWPAFGTPVIAFAVAVLAGVGIQSVSDGTIVLRRFLVIVAAVGLFVAVCIAATDRDLALGHHVLLLGGWPLAVGAGTIAATAVVVLGRRRPTDRRRGAVLIVGLVIIELLLLAPRGFYAPRADPFPKTEWLRFLQDGTRDDASRIFSTDGIVTPDTAGVFGLSDPRMVDALYVDRSWKYLRAFVSHGLEDRFVATGVAESAPAIAANQMFDLLGIRYLVFRASSHGPPSWSDPQYVEVYAGGGVKIYENTHVMPRAFVVHHVQRVADQQAAIRFLRSGEVGRFPDGSVQVTGKQMDQVAVVEAGRGSTPTTGECTGERDSTRMLDRSSTSVTMKVKSECAGLLVVSDAYYPGWSATVNNRRSRVYATDVALRGVEVPRGTSTVVFRYQPAKFRIGLLAGLLALVVVVVVGTWAFTRRRLKRRPVTR